MRAAYCTAVGAAGALLILIGLTVWAIYDPAWRHIFEKFQTLAAGYATIIAAAGAFAAVQLQIAYGRSDARHQAIQDQLARLLILRSNLLVIKATTDGINSSIDLYRILRDDPSINSNGVALSTLFPNPPNAPPDISDGIRCVAGMPDIDYNVARMLSRLATASGEMHKAALGITGFEMGDEQVDESVQSLTLRLRTYSAAIPTMIASIETAIERRRGMLPPLT